MPYICTASSSRSDYEVTELTWENGHLSEHGLGHPLRANCPTPKYPSSETLEAVVNQAKLLPPPKPSCQITGAPAQHNDASLVPWTAAASAIGSCSGAAAGKKRPRPAVDSGGVSGSPDSTRAADTFGTDNFTGGGGATGSPDTENTSNDHDTACHSRRSPSQSQKDIAGEEEEKITEGGTMRSTISTKRSRAAEVHNQSERKRRDRINQKIITLQKLVPNSNKTDKASMLDEVIEYLKQLQAQVQMMSRMGGMPTMMMPMGMQQFQMSMMAQIAQMAQMAQMGMGMGMMDMGSLARPVPAGISPVLPASAFLPVIGGSWEPSADRMQQPAGTVMPDPFSSFLSCPTQQPMTMDAYQRLGAWYQQLFQQAAQMNPK